MRLYDLAFSDLCVAKNLADCWIKKTPDAFDLEPITGDMAIELASLYNTIHCSPKASFVCAWRFGDNDDEIRFRVQRMDTLSGIVYICRRFMLDAQTLAELGFPPAVRNILMSVRDGLVIFCGKAGAGKTTAAYTYAQERLDAQGGVLWTVENPAERLIAGRHGKGVAYQIEVSTDEEMGSRTPMLLRATPNYIMYGEIRDPETLRQAIKLSLSGHLVIMTFHAGDLVSCITRMADFLGADASRIADALRAALCLELHQLGSVPKDALAVGTSTGTPPRVLGISPLIVDGLDSELKSVLREGGYHQLANIVEKKRRLFLNANLSQVDAGKPRGAF